MKLSEWIRYRDKLWIPHRKRTYLYWFKFLQEAELSPDHKVDWEKYDGWGGADVVLNQKFDEWWDAHWKKLFAVSSRGEKPKQRSFAISTTQPKTEAIRISLLIWKLRNTPPDWEPRTASRDVSRKASPRKGSNSLAIARRLKATEKRRATPIAAIDPDYIPKEGDSNETTVQSLVSRYMRAAKKTLANVCKGQFP